MPNGPLTSAGASGFGSQVSIWLGPPTSKSKMTDRSDVDVATVDGADGVQAQTQRSQADASDPQKIAPCRDQRICLICPGQSPSCHPPFVSRGPSF